mmetsp:Transcript_2183/g.4190  ORF Transcript_2183/g.4190 Transcript_2183/m.4190 type:complete len:156 (-) Transcript_2183:273-740(-)
MENERVRHPVRNDTGTGIVHAAPLLPLLLGNENPCPAKVWKDASGQLYVLMDRPRSNTSDGGQVPTISGLVENAEANTEAGSQFSSEIKSERKSTPPEGVQVTSNQAKYQKRNAPAEGTYPVLFILGFDAGILLDDIRKFRGGTSTLSRVFSCLT